MAVALAADPAVGPPTIDRAIPGDPQVMADKLALCERAIRDPQRTPEQVAIYGEAAQRIVYLLGNDPVLAADVIARLPEDVRSVAERNVKATAEIGKTVKLRTDLPPWRVVEPEPAEILLSHYKAAEAEFGVPWEILAAIHLVETKSGRLRGTSTAGAQGPMQFMPATWDAYGLGDIESTADSIRSAGNYLDKMGASKDMDKAIWHYNHSPAYVAAVKGYAGIMEEDPRAYYGYHAWQIAYRTVQGIMWLKPGYESKERQPFEPWCTEVGPEWCPPK